MADELGERVADYFTRVELLDAALTSGTVLDIRGGAAALALGALAGLYPAARAATMNPADAVRPTG